MGYSINSSATQRFVVRILILTMFFIVCTIAPSIHAQTLESTPSATPESTPTSIPVPTLAFTGIPGTPSYWDDLPANLKGFLEQVYLILAIWKRDTNMGHLLDGIVESTPIPPGPFDLPFIPDAPQWFSLLPTNLKGFLEQVYLTVKLWNRNSNMVHLLDGITNLTGSSYFTFNNRILSFETMTMRGQLYNGKFINLIDKRNNLVLISESTDVSGASISLPQLQSSLTITDDIPISYQSQTETTASVIYTWSDPLPLTLTYSFTIDPLTGELLLETVSSSNSTPISSNITTPFAESSLERIILGSGASYERNDEQNTDQSTYPERGFPSPVMAVLESSASALAVWSESALSVRDQLYLSHTPTHDTLRLSTNSYDSSVLTSTQWRIGIYPTWEASAKRWRESYEERTGAQPLWNNQAAWVRSIHAVHSANNTYYPYLFNQPKFDELAAATPPQKTLFLLWNGDRIVLFGDHTLAKNIALPEPLGLSIIQSKGWPLMLYHPANLIFSEPGQQARLTTLETNQYLPDGYAFTPDYPGGSVDNWASYWQGVTVPYFDPQFLVLHPGSEKTKSYLLQNIPDYVQTHQAQGLYLDILGADGSVFFPDSLLSDQHDYRAGMQAILSELHSTHPELGLMSEYISPETNPYVFYSWQGAEKYQSAMMDTVTRLNHPLRAALLGSYLWTRENNARNTDDIVSARLGGLPEVSLVGDHEVSDERALWSQQRAKLFTDYDLFYDLPDTWADDVIAYYRSNTGNWFTYKLVDTRHTYSEVLPDQSEIIRLQSE